MNKIKRFEELSQSNNACLTPVECPSCKQIFGISNKFLDDIEEVNFHFCCPYCGSQHGLKKN